MSRGVGQSVVFIGAGQAVPIVLAFFVTPFVVRRLGVEIYGALALALLILGYAELIDLGLSRALTRRVAELLAVRDLGSIFEVVTATVIMGVTVGMLLVGILELAAPWLAGSGFKMSTQTRQQALLAFRILPLFVPAVIVAALFRGALEGMERFDLTNGVGVVSAFLSSSMLAFGALAGLPLCFLVALLGGVRLVSMLVYAWLFTREVPVRTRVRGISQVNPLLGYGGWVMAGNLAWPLLAHLDRFVIAAFGSVRALGYFTAVTGIAACLRILPASVAVALFPSASRAANSTGGFVPAVAARLLRTQVAVMIPLYGLVATYADWILRLWLGADFAIHAGLALRIMVVGSFVEGMVHLPYAFLQGAGHPDVTTKIYLRQLAWYPWVSALATVRWGLPGVALVSTLRIVDVAVALDLACRRCLGVGMVRATFTRARPLLFVSASMAGVMTAPRLGGSESLVHALVAGAVAVVFYGLAVWRRVFDDEDRRVVASRVGWR